MPGRRLLPTTTTVPVLFNSQRSSNLASHAVYTLACRTSHLYWAFPYKRVRMLSGRYIKSYPLVRSVPLQRGHSIGTPCPTNTSRSCPLCELGLVLCRCECSLEVAVDASHEQFSHRRHLGFGRGAPGRTRASGRFGL